MRTRFAHHDYCNETDAGDYEILLAGQAAAIDDPRSSDVADSVRLLRENNVRKIILVHGTFAGNDILGLVREIARVSPQMAASMKSLGKGWFDRIAGDVGNYTEAFADRFRELLNDGEPSPTEVARFNWSGENTHLGRAAGAVSLLNSLQRHDWPEGSRVQIWAHSHGGNLLAMMGQLIGADENSIREFFVATRPYSKSATWAAVQSNLLHSKSSRGKRLPQIDVVNFGTPLRYRWNRSVHTNLLHIVQHRVTNEQSPAAGSIPSSLQDVLDAKGGDYVQQLGIGGTDFLPSVFAPRTWMPERRLAKMFATGVRRIDLKQNLKRCQRVSLDGKTLLVDYPDSESEWNRKLLGHGVYTRHELIPFHLNEAMRRFTMNTP